MASVYSDPSPFLGFHQQLSLLLNGAEDGWGTEEMELHLRKCSTFLHFLLCYVHRYTRTHNGNAMFIGTHAHTHNGNDTFLPRYVSSSEQQDSTEKVAMAILPQLLRLHSQLAPLEEQLTTLSGRGQLVSSTNQIAHFSLHIHWTLLCVLYTMAPVTGEFAPPPLSSSHSCSSPFSPGSTHFLQQAYATLRSLLSYAASTYNQVCSVNGHVCPPIDSALPWTPPSLSTGRDDHSPPAALQLSLSALATAEDYFGPTG